MKYRINKTFIFLFLFIATFLLSLFINYNKINIPYYNALHKEVQVDVIFKKNPPQVFYDNIEFKNYLKIDKNHYLFKTNDYPLIKKISFKNSSDIEQIGIFVGNDGHFYKKTPKTIEINNQKKVIDKFAISILSFIYNPYYYIISYIFLFLFLYNFKINYKTKFFIIGIIFLSFILRIAQINNIPFWDDEIYVLASSASYSKLSELFNDAGNPPLYFILFKIYRTIFQNPDFYRFSAVITGVLFNFCFYTYIKSRLDKKYASIGLIVACFNIILIYFSQEIRCYMLLALLTIINSYYLFKFKNKTKFQYLLSSIAILYTHYYATFFILYNFFIGIALFFKNKIKLKNFLLVNFIAFLSFIPHIFYKKQNLVNEFNSWMKAPNLASFSNAINIFVGKIIFLFIFLILCFWIYKNLSKKREKLFLNYNLYLIVFIFICSSLFSCLIKPIFHYKYFYIAYPAYLVLISIFIGFNYKTKLKILLSFIIFLLFTTNSKLNYQNLFCNHNLYLDYVKFDLDETKNSYIFMTDTVEKYQEFKIKNANIIYLPVNHGINEIDLNEYNFNKGTICYIPNLYLSKKTIDKVQKILLFKTPLGIFCKVQI